jgi:hypothetical protein
MKADLLNGRFPRWSLGQPGPNYSGAQAGQRLSLKGEKNRPVSGQATALQDGVRANTHG